MSSEYQVRTERKQPWILRHEYLPGLVKKHAEKVKHVNPKMAQREDRYNGYHFANHTFSLLYENPPRRRKPFTVNSAQFEDDLNIMTKTKAKGTKYSITASIGWRIFSKFGCGQTMSHMYISSNSSSACLSQKLCFLNTIKGIDVNDLEKN